MNIHPHKRLISNIAYLHEVLKNISLSSEYIKGSLNEVTSDLKNSGDSLIDEKKFSALSDMNKFYHQTLSSAKVVRECIDELEDVLKNTPMSEDAVVMNETPAILTPVEVMVLQSINDNLYSTDDITELRELTEISQQTINDILDNGMERAVLLNNL